jgi:CBS domain-containing protein
MEAKMVLVRQLLNRKGGNVITVSPQASLGAVIDEMYNHDIGVVVVLEGDSIRGIFSERDFARAFATKKDLNLTSPVATLMTQDVISVAPEATVDECMILMTDNHIRHLPVVENGHLVGLISIGDLVKTLIAERDGTIRGLENYILGTDYNR